MLLGIVISVLLVMFCVYGTKLIYEEPKYSDFCDNTYYPEYPIKTIDTANCSLSVELKEKANDCYKNGGIPRFDYDENGCEYDLFCDMCNAEYNKVSENHSKNLFVISLVVGIIIISASVIFIKIPAISGGLMLGSLFYIVFGTANYWSFMEDILRFVILGIALGVLIWLAYYLSNKNISKKTNYKKKTKK